MKMSRHRVTGSPDILFMDDSERSRRILQMLDAADIAVWIEKASSGESMAGAVTREEFPTIIAAEGTFYTDAGLEWWIKRQWPKSIEGHEDKLCFIPDHLNFCELVR